MRSPIHEVIRGVILLAFSAMIFNLHLTGEIEKFINPKYNALSKTVAILFLFLFLVQLIKTFASFQNHRSSTYQHQCCNHHSHESSKKKKVFSYSIIILPIITGFLVPAKTLDASVAEKKGGMMIISQKTQDKKLIDYAESVMSSETNGNMDEFGYAEDPNLAIEKKELPKNEYSKLRERLAKKSTVSMDNENYTVYYNDILENLPKYIGKKIKFTGFVLKEKSFKQNQLVISRFLITHCIADASILGFLSEFPEAPNLKEDTWLEATGTISKSTYKGETMPTIKINNWRKIKEPKKPYIYPIDIIISP